MDGERKHFERSQKTKGEKVKAMEYAKEKDPFVMPRQKEKRPARSSVKEDIGVVGGGRDILLFFSSP